MTPTITNNRAHIRATVAAHSAANPRYLDRGNSPVIIVDFKPTATDKERERLQGQITETLGVDVQLLEPADLPGRERLTLLSQAVRI